MPIYKYKSLLRQLPPKIRREFDHEMKESGMDINQSVCTSISSMLVYHIDFFDTRMGRSWWQTVVDRIHAIERLNQNRKREALI